ncbi:MAG: zinc ribbon domain-containing protein, partial [Coriobacteriia bacterium]|nr:zinc ribbon domain-containing protein [Coriobacteriia bacterium]
MPFCRQCGKETPVAASFCASCGTLLSKRASAVDVSTPHFLDLGRARALSVESRRSNPAAFYATIAVVLLVCFLLVRWVSFAGTEPVELNSMRFRVPGDWSVSGSNRTVRSENQSPDQAMANAANAFSSYLLDRENAVDFSPAIYNESDGESPVGGYISVQPASRTLVEQVDSFNRGIYDGGAETSPFSAGNLKGSVLTGYQAKDGQERLTFVLTDKGDESAGWYVLAAYWASDDAMFDRFEKDWMSIMKSLRVDA